VTQEVEPGLATRWEIAPDNKTFTFYIRKGVCWSDGHPFTADDVVFTFQAIYDPRFPNRAAFDLSVDGKKFTIEKVDDLTVRLTTPEIYAPFLETVGGVGLLPKHELESAFRDGSLLKAWNVSIAQKEPRRLLATGPFRLRSYQPAERIVFEANPHYWRADTQGVRLPYVDYLVTKLVKDANASTLAFATGQTDAEGLSPDNVAWIDRYATRYGFSVFNRGPSPNTGFIWFNQNPGKDASGKPFVPPHKLAWFTDRRFRQAVSHGIDREGLVRGVLFGRGQPLWGPETPANKKWYNPNVTQYPFNPARSMELLNQSGFSLGQDQKLRDRLGNIVEFTLNTNQENQLRANMATAFKENMRDLGITVNLSFLDFGTLVGKIQDSYDYEAGMLGLTGGGDPAGGISVFSSKGRLHQWHPNQKNPATPWEARIDQLMSDQLHTLDYPTRKKYFDEVQKIMSDETPYIYLVTANAYVGLKDRWKNIRIPPLGSLVWNLDELWTPLITP
jgi:peptide/nickel transport system substrate-binding protein